jgi:hypothetical protein
MPFWCLQFPPKTNKNKSHSCKIEFVCLFFGGNIHLKKSFRFCLTFNSPTNHPTNNCISWIWMAKVYGFFSTISELDSQFWFTVCSRRQLLNLIAVCIWLISQSTTNCIFTTSLHYFFLLYCYVHNGLWY